MNTLKNLSLGIGHIRAVCIRFDGVWRSSVSFIVSVLMVLSGLPLWAFMSPVAHAAAPAAPTLALQSPSSSPGNDSTPTIRVTVDSTNQSGSVELFSDSTCSTSISSSATVSGATVDVTTSTLTEANSPYTIYAKHTVGADSTCSTSSVSYTYDGTAPSFSSAIYSGSMIR